MRLFLNITNSQYVNLIMLLIGVDISPKTLFSIPQVSEKKHDISFLTWIFDLATMA